MARPVEKFVAYNLRETYHELGEYEFKVVLHPRVFKNSHESSLSLVDSDGKPMSFVIKKWGRKINCSFTVDENVADGVSVARLEMRDERGEIHQGRFSFWVIKP